MKLKRGDKVIFRYEQSTAYYLRKTHGEIFTTSWTVDYEPLSSIIEDMQGRTTTTWSVACLEEYDYKVTFRFISPNDADYFQSKYCSDCDRKVLIV